MRPGYNLKYVLGILLLILLIAGGLYRSRKKDRAPQWTEITRMGLHTHVEIKWRTTKKTEKKIIHAIDSILVAMDVLFSEENPSHPFKILSRSPRGTKVRLDGDQKNLLDFFLARSSVSPYPRPLPLQLGAGEWVYRYGLSEDSSDASFTRAARDSLMKVFQSPYFVYDSSSGRLELTVDSLHLSLGSVSKGYGIQKMAACLQKFGVGDFLINAGGDMYYSGVNPRGGPWTIGIQHPRKTPENPLIGIIQTPNFLNGLATSGDYELFKMVDGKRIHHIINAQTGKPISDKQSMTVLAPDALLADFYATFFFLLPLQEVLALADADAAIEIFAVDSAGRSHFSSDMKKYFSPP